ncbi:hypothetical protein FDH02_gp36 [Pseudomonas phage VSW-3]|uniref:Uncharacterized protein n=1 Tax=Pseudomonas phage VSW-3 TaxID=1852562 RepID=A0A173GCQ9_9CAUD|nr:hypothetical protein FDH02_gp36 [Pseudomonas phage VSW-3]ANH51112.1 hypothetical protein VSW3_36 [Pseudomonas phage VSW-3]
MTMEDLAQMLNLAALVGGSLALLMAGVAMSMPKRRHW